MEKKKGIAVAGNMIVDILYPIQKTPRPGELANILDGIEYATGGALCNVIVDLAKLDPTLPLCALGRVGDDAEGGRVLAALGAHPNIDMRGVKREGITSFTAVMADQSSKQRTFYHYRGANAAFTQADIDLDALDASLFHIGYILLLDGMDAPDEQYGTKMARLLHDVQARGIKTSVDVVSEAGDRFCRLVPPALRYADYCIINELEAQESTGVQLRDAQGVLLRENMPKALARMKELGVSTWAVIHCPEGSYGLDAENGYAEVSSLSLPPDYIKGSVGAGDAFCAGVLYGAWRGDALEAAMRLGTAAAACSLSESGATEGMRSAAEAMELYARLS